jgi:hypothetical protein
MFLKKPRISGDPQGRLNADERAVRKGDALTEAFTVKRDETQNRQDRDKKSAHGYRSVAL